MDAFLKQLKLRGTSRLTVADLLTLAAAGQALLNTNKEIKGDNRRMLRVAVNRAKRTVENA